MEPEDFLSYVVKNIHTAVVATVDDEGLPVTAAIDMMDADADGLYFLTARGKALYDRLKKRGFLAFTAVKGEETLSSVAVSVRGKVRELGPGRVPGLFAKNPYMEEIYPSAASRQALTAFQIYEGRGEWFDLSQKPVERASFAFGGADARTGGYFITDACTGCLSCADVCPQKCIDAEKTPPVVNQAHCLRCGNCLAVCPAGAVERRR